MCVWGDVCVWGGCVCVWGGYVCVWGDVCVCVRVRARARALFIPSKSLSKTEASYVLYNEL